MLLRHNNSHDSHLRREVTVTGSREEPLAHRLFLQLEEKGQKKLVILDTCNAGKGGKEIQIALLQQTRGLTDATAVKLLQRAVGSSFPLLLIPATGT